MWIGVLVGAIVLTMPQAAALTETPAATGDTHVTNSDCQIWLATPHNQTVSLQASPDTVRVWMNISWFDERSANSTMITHWFHMDTTYGSTYCYADHNETTTGGMASPSTGRFYMDVGGVTRSTSMWVHYSVTVLYTLSGTVICSLDNSSEWPPVTFNFT